MPIAIPWRCPACGTPIHHAEALPNPAVTYRCQVCRLELSVDADTGRLAVVPLADEHQRTLRTQT
jgi:rubredoxin